MHVHMHVGVCLFPPLVHRLSRGMVGCARVGCSLEAPFRHRLGGRPPPYRAALPVPLGVLGNVSRGDFKTDSFKINEKAKVKVRANFPFKFSAGLSGFSVLDVPGGVRRGPPFVPLCLMRLRFWF